MRKATSKIRPSPKLIDWMKYYGQDRSEWDRMSEDAIPTPGSIGVTPELVPFNDEYTDMLEQMDHDADALRDEYLTVPP